MRELILGLELPDGNVMAKALFAECPGILAPKLLFPQILALKFLVIKWES